MAKERQSRKDTRYGSSFPIKSLDFVLEVLQEIEVHIAREEVHVCNKEMEGEHVEVFLTKRQREFSQLW